MSDGDGMPIMTAFNLIGVEVFGQLAYWRSAKFPLHNPNAGAAEKQNYAAMPVIFLLAKLIEPLIDQWRDAALLRPDLCM